MACVTELATRACSVLQSPCSWTKVFATGRRAIRLMPVGPTLGRLPRGVGALPIALPVASGADAVDASWAGDRLCGLCIEHHHRLLTLAGLVERRPKQPAIGADRFVRGAEMFLRAIPNRGHRRAGPLIVHVDVGPHAGIGRVFLLVRVEAVIVVLVLAWRVIRQFVKLEPLAAHLVLVHGRAE